MRRSKTKVKHNGGIKSPLTPKMIVSRFFHRDLYSGRSYSQYCQQSMDQPRKSLARRQLNRGIWSNETGSAVPSCASLLVLPAQAKSVFYSQDSSRFPRRRPHIPLTAIGFIGSSKCGPMAFTAENTLAQGQYSLRQFQERVLPFQVSP